MSYWCARLTQHEADPLRGARGRLMPTLGGMIIYKDMAKMNSTQGSFERVLRDYAFNKCRKEKEKKHAEIGRFQ